MQPDQLIQTISLAAIPVLFAITLHEAAHGYVARHFGDMTAYQQGRISLNPLHHIDPVGTILFPLLTLWLGGILFGWAKPVPVDPRHFRSPQRGMMLVGAAGPLTNFAIAVAASQLLRVTVDEQGLLFKICWDLYVLNLLLGFLNLLPIPPLDGSRVIGGLLPERLYPAWVSLDRFGNLLFLVLFVILVSNPTAFNKVFYPLFRGVSQVLLPGWV